MAHYPCSETPVEVQVTAFHQRAASDAGGFLNDRTNDPAHGHEHSGQHRGDRLDDEHPDGGALQQGGGPWDATLDLLDAALGLPPHRSQGDGT